jgi:SH3-like domain-containing protein
MKLILNLTIILLFFFSFNVFSENNNYFLILKNNKVNVRHGPGFDFPIKFIYKKKNLPVKIIDKKENFRRIIDLKKNSGWIHSSQLSKKKSIIILKDKILFKKPTEYSKPVAKILTGRLLIIKNCKKEWCKIIVDNYSGWVKTDNVWGKIN